MGNSIDSEDCRALDVGRENFLRLPHLSDRYFTWANAVVEGVLFLPIAAGKQLPRRNRLLHSLSELDWRARLE